MREGGYDFLKTDYHFKGGAEERGNLYCVVNSNNNNTNNNSRYYIHKYSLSSVF